MDMDFGRVPFVQEMKPRPDQTYCRIKSNMQCFEVLTYVTAQLRFITFLCVYPNFEEHGHEDLLRGARTNARS